MKDKLCIWSSYFIDLNPYDMILEFEKAGIHHTELSDEHGIALLKEDLDEAKVGKKFGQFAKEHGVEITQGHLWLNIRLCDDADQIPELKKWINLFEAIGIRNMVLHLDSFFYKTHSYSDKELMDININKLKALVPFLKGKNIVICLENLYDGPAYDADDLLYVINELNSENFGICLDTGHLNINPKPYPRNQRDFILKAGNKLQALHVADNQGGVEDQHLMPFGKGNVNFKEVIQTCNEIHYPGVFNYEIPGENRIPLEIRRMKLKYIKDTYEWMIDNYLSE